MARRKKDDVESNAASEPLNPAESVEDESPEETLVGSSDANPETLDDASPPTNESDNSQTENTPIDDPGESLNADQADGQEPDASSEEVSSGSSDDSISAPVEELPEDPDLESMLEPASDSEPAEREPFVAKAKRPSFWTRIKNWFRRKRQVSPEQPSEPTSVTESVNVSLLTPDELRAELKKLKGQVEIGRANSETLQTSINEIQEERERLDVWLEALQRSYFWRVEEKMGSNLQTAKDDIAEFEEIVNSLELPEKGQLRSLRQQFHKGLTRSLIFFSIPVALLFFIPWFSRIDLGANITSIFRSPLYFVGVLTLVAIVIGITSLLRRVLGKTSMPRRRSVWWAFLAAAIPMAIFVLYYFQQWIEMFVTPIVERIRPTSLWVIGILFFFAVLTVLIIYYQGWTVFRKTVNDQLVRLSNVATGYVKTKQEIARLESLYSQTQRWMFLLAHSLYRPWKIHPDWKQKNVATATSESFPLALRVAQALETDAAEVAQLRRSIAHSLLVQGWRSSAFERTLSQIGTYLGYEADKITPSLLDEDLPHQPNNSQKLVLSFFNHSGETAAQGLLDLGKRENVEGVIPTQPTPSDVYLVEVARSFLSELAESAQDSGLSQARPSVEQVMKDPLADIRDSDDIAPTSEVFEWDEFLADSLNISDQMQPPMGVLAFTDSGRKSRSAEVPTTKVLVPERLANSIPKPRSNSVEVIPVSTAKKQSPAEVIVRLDLVGPLPFDHVSLIQNSYARPQSFANEEENHDL